MPTRLTAAGVRNFEARIRKRHPGVVFALTMIRASPVGNAIELTTLIVERRKCGTGTAIMKELCGFADRRQAQIKLIPASKGDYAATTSRRRLIRFYKRFGFVEDKTNHRDPTLIPGMFRRPA